MYGRPLISDKRPFFDVQRLVFLSSNDLGIGKLLLGKGADINLQNNDGMAAIHLTVLKGNTRFLQWLLREKCDVNLKVMYSILHLIIVRTLREDQPLRIV